jgi:hypothetical protein
MFVPPPPTTGGSLHTGIHSPASIAIESYTSDLTTQRPGAKKYDEVDFFFKFHRHLWELKPQPACPEADSLPRDHRATKKIKIKVKGGLPRAYAVRSHQTVNGEYGDRTIFFLHQRFIYVVMSLASNQQIKTKSNKLLLLKIPIWSRNVDIEQENISPRNVDIQKNCMVWKENK